MGYLDSLLSECLHHIGDSTMVLVRPGGHNIFVVSKYLGVNSLYGVISIITVYSCIISGYHIN